MAVTLKDINIELDIESFTNGRYGADKNFTVDVSSDKSGEEALGDVESQVEAFAEALKSKLDARGVEIKVGGKVLKDFTRFFKGVNQEGQQQQ